MSDLRELLAGGTLRVLLHFLLHPERRLHFRALQEQTGLGTGALQRELARFEALGLVTRTEEAGGSTISRRRTTRAGAPSARWSGTTPNRRRW